MAARVLRGGERRGAPLPARVVHRRGEGRDRRAPPRTLVGLQLLECAVDDAGAESLAAALADGGADLPLRCLHLGSNRIGARGAAALAAALPPRLEVLGLEHNALGDSGAAALAAQIGGGGGGTPPGGGGGSGLASPTPRAAPTALDLAGNGIGDDGLLPLLDALACNERLQQLDLRDNPIQQKALALEPSVASSAARRRQAARAAAVREPIQRDLRL